MAQDEPPTFHIHALIAEHLKLADIFETTFHNYRPSGPTQFEFAENDLVWVATANILQRNQPCSKLCELLIGPYAISARISSHAYRLRLPPSMQCYNVFYISKLKQCDSVKVEGATRNAYTR
jgi:hypothetical protein